MKRISVLLLALLMALACASALAETAADQGYTVKTGVSYDDPWGITVANVIYKDGQVFNPGSGFRKTWRIYNNGSCTWDSNYYLDFAGGDRMNGSSVRVPGTVKPGQTVDISVDMTAPNNAGK